MNKKHFSENDAEGAPTLTRATVSRGGTRGSCPGVSGIGDTLPARLVTRILSQEAIAS